MIDWQVHGAPQCAPRRARPPHHTTAPSHTTASVPSLHPTTPHRSVAALWRLKKSAIEYNKGACLCTLCATMGTGTWASLDESLGNGTCLDAGTEHYAVCPRLLRPHAGTWARRPTCTRMRWCNIPLTHTANPQIRPCSPRPVVQARGRDVLPVQERAGVEAVQGRCVLQRRRGGGGAGPAHQGLLRVRAEPVGVCMYPINLYIQHVYLGRPIEACFVSVQNRWVRNILVLSLLGHVQASMSGWLAPSGMAVPILVRLLQQCGTYVTAGRVRHVGAESVTRTARLRSFRSGRVCRDPTTSGVPHTCRKAASREQGLGRVHRVRQSPVARAFAACGSFHAPLTPPTHPLHPPCCRLERTWHASKPQTVTSGLNAIHRTACARLLRLCQGPLRHAIT